MYCIVSFTSNLLFRSVPRKKEGGYCEEPSLQWRVLTDRTIWYSAKQDVCWPHTGSPVGTKMAEGGSCCVWSGKISNE